MEERYIYFFGSKWQSGKLMMIANGMFKIAKLMIVANGREVN